MKKQITIVLIALMMLSTVALVAAQEVINEDEVIELNYFQELKYRYPALFGPFSVVGNTIGCSLNPDKEIKISDGIVSVDCSDAGVDNCLIDVFRSDSSFNQYDPYKEYLNSVNIVSTSSSSQYWIAQIYACPYDPVCNSDNDCESERGTGSQCIEDNPSDERIPFSGGTWTYCTEPTGSTVTPITCYYISGSSCISQTFTTTDNCPVSQGAVPYTSLSACQSSLSGTTTTTTGTTTGETTGGTTTGTTSGQTDILGTGSGDTASESSELVQSIEENKLYIGIAGASILILLALKK